MKIIQRACLVAFLLAAPVCLAAEAIAFITNLKGEVALDGNPRPTLLAELAKGQKLTVGKDSQVSVMYVASGKEYVLKGPADYLVKDTEISGFAAGMPPMTRDTAWRPSNKVLVQVAHTAAASVRMRSFAPPKRDEAKLIYPTQGSVASLQPTFRWRAADAREQAEFALLAAGQEKPVHVGKATGGSYRAPAKLRPDTDYVWTVTVAGNELGAGRFSTLSTEALAQVERRKPAEKAEFSDRLLYTLMLHEMGATQEARESWEKLSHERTDLPELAAFAR